MNESPDLAKSYIEYDQTKDSVKFVQKMKALCRGEFSEDDAQKALQVGLSSPEDERLVKRKKAKAQKNQVKAPEMFGDTVQSCQEGLSPKVTFNRRNYGDDEDYEAESD
jgi:hypothetical protein